MVGCRYACSTPRRIQFPAQILENKTPTTRKKSCSIYVNCSILKCFLGERSFSSFWSVSGGINVCPARRGISRPVQHELRKGGGTIFYDNYVCLFLSPVEIAHGMTTMSNSQATIVWARLKLCCAVRFGACYSGHGAIGYGSFYRTTQSRISAAAHLATSVHAPLLAIMGDTGRSCDTLGSHHTLELLSSYGHSRQETLANLSEIRPPHRA